MGPPTLVSSVVPTAHTSSRARMATPFKILSGKSFGLVARDHADPSKWRTSVCAWPDWTKKPTAHTSLDDNARTERSRALPVPGLGTPVTTDHDDPFQRSTIGT